MFDERLELKLFAESFHVYVTTTYPFAAQFAVQVICIFVLVNTRPPMRSRASRTVTFQPAPAKMRAAVKPDRPAPITIKVGFSRASR
jgi:hypothetical protein